ncbi:sulfate transporter 1,2 [Artemisia annua]|uniref:Sulfate transporter 1,2 n=1 Tax=Artemisia annua TaxID=35608 RepID=A0A2U1L798_ARTAN|nr:sulfate transporter 1,2 [Artemisia annua]
MGGAAITIALQQLKGFLGIKHFTKKMDIVSVMKSVFGSIEHGWNWQTIVIGASFLAFLLSAKYLGKNNKKLYWVSAIAPLISVILSTLFVYIAHADKEGVAIVKHIEKGINPLSVNEIYFSGENLLKGFRIGIVAGMIALTVLFRVQLSQYLLLRSFFNVTDIDTSGIHAFEELYRSLVKRDVQLVLANPGRLVLDKLYSSGFPDLIGENKIFLTVAVLADAVLTCSPKIVQEV